MGIDAWTTSLTRLPRLGAARRRARLDPEPRPPSGVRYRLAYFVGVYGSGVPSLMGGSFLSDIA